MPTYRQVIMLNATDYDRFMAILEKPPEPNLALQKAFKAYKELCVTADIQVEIPKQD